MELFILLIPLLIAYLIGSIPFGVILGKLAGIGDIRKTGSGNIGATNMLRAGGKKLAIMTLLLDMGKCAILLLACIILINNGEQRSADTGKELFLFAFYPLFSFMTIMGHIYPIWLKFRGGKGVATMIGYYIGFACIFFPLGIPMIYALSAPLGWILVFSLFRISSVAGMSAAWMPVIIACIASLISPYPVIGLYYGGISLLIALLITRKHRENIKRLRKGEEPKISFKKKG